MESVFNTFSTYLSKIVKFFINNKGIIDEKGIDFMNNKIKNRNNSFDETILVEAMVSYLKSDDFIKNSQCRLNSFLFIYIKIK